MLNKETRERLLGATLEWLKAGAPAITTEAAFAPGIMKNRVNGDVRFNMDHVVATGEFDYSGEHCGTVCCMLGHAWLTLGDDEVEALMDNLDTALNELFYPSSSEFEYPRQQVTPALAAAVLAHYIETGDTCWKLAFTE